MTTRIFALNRIGATRNDPLEEAHAGERLDELAFDEVPPCFPERVNFLSPKPQKRLTRHA